MVLTLRPSRMWRDDGDSAGEGTSQRWLVGDWGGVRWAAAPPGAAGASMCPRSEAEPSGAANRLVVRRRKDDQKNESIVAEPKSPTPPYTWGTTHAAWNLLTAHRAREHHRSRHAHHSQPTPEQTQGRHMVPARTE